MKGVQFGTIDDSGLMTNQHPFSIIEAVDYHSSGVSKANLEYGLLVLSPPCFTDCCMIITKSQKMSRNGKSSGYFWNTLDLFDICGYGELNDSLIMIFLAKDGKGILGK